MKKYEIIRFKNACVYMGSIFEPFLFKIFLKLFDYLLTS